MPFEIRTMLTICLSLLRLSQQILSTVWLKQQQCILFWRLRGPRSRYHQNVSHLNVLLMVCRWPPSHSMLTWPLLYARVRRESRVSGVCSSEDTNYEGPTPTISWTLITSQGPSSNTITLEVKASIHEFWEVPNFQSSNIIAQKQVVTKSGYKRASGMLTKFWFLNWSLVTWKETM